jgi:subtilase family serine protease
MAEAPSIVSQQIDPHQTLAKLGNVRPEVSAANDRGRVEDSLVLEHMQLLLNRPAVTEAALKRFLDAQQDRSAPEYHQWLTAEEFGAKYGPSLHDVGTVVAWLQANGFTVNNVQPSRMMIDFSGTAGAVHTAFQTEIHRLNVNGVAHIANVSNPRVPAALADVVNGVVSLHDFRPHTNFKPKPAYTFTSSGSTFQAVVPADLATIYNFNPLFTAGTSGQGQTIVVIEDTNVYSTADWTTFRSTFGLSKYTSGSFTQVHPGSGCSNPGTVAGAEGEATLDAEWASAGAPSAAIELASCADTQTTFGGLIALQNLVNGSSPPAIVSISYGECEAENGASANAAFNTTYQQAVAEGISVFVSAGDEGAASCDANLTKATHGIAVSGFASSPYDVAVGGTDFGDTYAGTTGTYWSSTNSSTYGSALSYIPEIPWNDSCASVLLATASGYSTTYGSSGFCNSSTGKANYLTTGGGSGGPSGCATGSPSTSGVVSGTCKGYAKPSWQSLVGVPSDGVRDMPDVSLFAANGVWGHYYVYCDSDTRDGGAKCTGAPSGWSGAGGTSFAAPIVAAIQALVNQKHGKQGNPNPTYYSLAKTEYGSGGSSTCNSTNGGASSCNFYDVTQGDMDVDCTGSYNCYKPSGTYGVLSTSTSSYKPAYGTTTGWDFATGIGTVNAANLVNNW